VLGLETLFCRMASKVQVQALCIEPKLAAGELIQSITPNTLIGVLSRYPVYGFRPVL
jgi:hypothetical protein